MEPAIETHREPIVHTPSNTADNRWTLEGPECNTHFATPQPISRCLARESGLCGKQVPGGSALTIIKFNEIGQDGDAHKAAPSVCSEQT